MPYGLTEFAVKDPNGYLLSFGQPTNSWLVQVRFWPIPTKSSARVDVGFEGQTGSEFPFPAPPVLTQGRPPVRPAASSSRIGPRSRCIPIYRAVLSCFRKQWPNSKRAILSRRSSGPRVDLVITRGLRCRTDSTLRSNIRLPFTDIQSVNFFKVSKIGQRGHSGDSRVPPITAHHGIYR
jgi:hypothetical protein